jgi:hypothetical protein
MRGSANLWLKMADHEYILIVTWSQMNVKHGHLDLGRRWLKWQPLSVSVFPFERF